MFRIREAREACNMTQAALAEKLGINGVTLSGYETGKHDPKSDTLIKIAQICGVTVDFLLGRETQGGSQVSDKAMKLAQRYDGLSDYAKAIIDCVLEQEEKLGKVMFKTVPIIGEAKLDGTVEMKEAARRELKDVKEEDLIVLKPDLI